MTLTCEAPTGFLPGEVVPTKIAPDTKLQYFMNCTALNTESLSCSHGLSGRAAVTSKSGKLQDEQLVTTDCLSFSLILLVAPCYAIFLNIPRQVQPCL